MNLQEISIQIKKTALEIGFNDCGFAKVEQLNFNKEKLIFAIENGFTSELSFLNNNIEKRSNPSLLLDNAKTVISVIASYAQVNNQQKSKYKISKYAFSNDYHFIVKTNLEKLFVKIKEIFPDVNGKVFCDTAPIFEKEWAKQAGLGWIGKNNLLINKKLGSFVFIGEIIIDKELFYDNPFNFNCGNCNLCVRACPTNAIQPYLLNVNKCISFLTIENKSEIISEEFKKQIKNEIYGCDICQTVCPYNMNVDSVSNKFFAQNEYVNWNYEKWENLNELQFNKFFKQTAIKRIGLKKLKRNIEFVNSNY